jgi:hypothetical protein
MAVSVAITEAMMAVAVAITVCAAIGLRVSGRHRPTG